MANTVDFSLLLILSKIFPTSCLHTHTWAKQKENYNILVQKKEIKEANPLKFKYTCYYYTYIVYLCAPTAGAAQMVGLVGL